MTRALRARQILLVAAPLLAILTFMLGLRIGAGEAVKAATVFGAPFGQKAPNGKTRIAWQVQTFLDDRGVKEVITVDPLIVTARAKGAVATWRGTSNEDGVAEVALELPDLAYGDPLEIEVRMTGDATPLAQGLVTWAAVDAPDAGGTGRDRSAGSLGGERRVTTGGAVRPTLREGGIGIDVLVEGDRLVAGGTGTLWVRATANDHQSLGGLVVELDPEPGLDVPSKTSTTCANGFAEAEVIPRAHITGTGIAVRSPTTSGKWFGALPVAPGGTYLDPARVRSEGEAWTERINSEGPRRILYAELDDERGRITAAVLPVYDDQHPEPGNTMKSARYASPVSLFEIPALSPGLYWLVASGEPRGAEHLSGATMARAFWVGAAPPEEGLNGAPVDPKKRCSIGPWLALHSAPGFPRWTALEGLPSRSAANRVRHTTGLLIGLVSLLAAAILESLLLVAASRESRIALELAALDDEALAASVTRKTPGGGVVVAILVTVLGLALLAVLLVAKG